MDERDIHHEKERYTKELERINFLKKNRETILEWLRQKKLRNKSQISTLERQLRYIRRFDFWFKKDYILKALLNGKRNKKWINDVNKSLWKETDNQKFLQKFKLLLDKKANLIKREIKKVDNNFDIDYLTNEAMSTWISLPTNFEIKDLPDNYKFQIELIDFL